MFPTVSLRSRILRGGAAAVVALALFGCAPSQSTLDDAGAMLSGRLKIEPLVETPPAGRVTVQMLPLSGVPVTVADGIYRAFRAGAANADIDLVHRLEDPATWRIQGHFVALGHSSTTTILYTYDIYDAAGRPVHRIFLQDVAEAAEGDAWGGVGGDVQGRIATQSLRAIQAWLKRAPR